MPRWSLNPTTSVLTREEKRTQPQRKRSALKMATEMGAFRQQQAKGLLEAPKASGRKDLP